VEAALIELARELGADDAAAVAAASIVVEDRLAALCTPAACPFYGQSAGCPPYATGPEAFRLIVETYRRTVVLKIEVPSALLRAGRSEEHFRQLHQIAARVERQAVRMGATRARAFAGGSCKHLFCAQEEDCPVVAGSGACRYPDIARPSMSGCGVNVTRLMAAAGWPFSPVTAATDCDQVPTGSICALVLVD
jgi:predicted metal-binding protein